MPTARHHQPEPAAAQSFRMENAGIAERLHNAVAKQAPNGHGYGETRESQTCAREASIPRSAVMNSAPQSRMVPSLRYMMKHNTPIRSTIPRGTTNNGVSPSLPVGQEMPPERRQQRDHEQANDEHGQMRR